MTFPFWQLSLQKRWLSTPFNLAISKDCQGRWIFSQVKELPPSHQQRTDETSHKFSIKISPWSKCPEGSQVHRSRMLFPANCHANLIYQHGTCISHRSTAKVSSEKLTNICYIPYHSFEICPCIKCQPLELRKITHITCSMKEEEGNHLILCLSHLLSDNTLVADELFATCSSHLLMTSTFTC